MDEKMISADPSKDENSSVLPEEPEQYDGESLEQYDGEVKAGAESGSTEDGETIDVVRNVVSDQYDAQEPVSRAGEKQSGEASDDGGEKPKPDDEAFTDVPFNKHPRFKQLIGQRNRYRQDAESHRQDAESHRQVQKFLENAGLSANEAADGLVLMGLMKTNPVEAWRRMKPVIQNLLTAAGEVLPPDLDAMVRQEQLGYDAALEVSRARAGQVSAQYSLSHMQRQTQMQQMQQMQQMRHMQQMQQQQAIVSAMNDWEATRKRNDPNYEAKQEQLREKLAYIWLQEGKPTSPDKVLSQCDRAYSALSPVQVKKRITPARSSENPANIRPKEQTTLDIIRAYVEGRS